MRLPLRNLNDPAPYWSGVAKNCSYQRNQHKKNFLYLRHIGSTSFNMKRKSAHPINVIHFGILDCEITFKKRYQYLYEDVSWNRKKSALLDINILYITVFIIAYFKLKITFCVQWPKECVTVSPFFKSVERNLYLIFSRFHPHLGLVAPQNYKPLLFFFVIHRKHFFINPRKVRSL
jgi:hypothetical protein